MIPSEAKALYTVGEIKVSYDADRTTPRPKITCSMDAYNVLASHWSDRITLQEEFYVLCLDRSNAAIGIYLVSVGSVSGTVADPKIIFQVALGTHSTSIILAHNHPSGNMTASQGDKEVTARYRQIAKLFDMAVLDHLILSPTPGVYLSFADEGILTT